MGWFKNFILMFFVATFGYPTIAGTKRPFAKERWSIPFAKAFVLSAGQYCLHPPQGKIYLEDDQVVAEGDPVCVEQLQNFSRLWAERFHIDMVTLEGSPDRLLRFRNFIEDHHSLEEAQIAIDTSACTCLALFGSHAASLASVYHKTHNNIAPGSRSHHNRKWTHDRLREEDPVVDRSPSGLIWQWQSGNESANGDPLPPSSE